MLKRRAKGLFSGSIRFPSEFTVEYEQVDDKAVREMGAKE
jgi:hypothetical protein